MVITRLVASATVCAALFAACDSANTTSEASAARTTPSAPLVWSSAAAIHATYVVSYGRLGAQAWLVNESSAPLVGQTGYCSLWYRVYADPSRSGAPVWRSEDRPTPIPGVFACPTVAYLVSLSPGDSVPLPPQVFDEVEQVAKAGPGTYYVSLTLTLDQPHMTLEELPAGEFVVGGDHQ